MGPDACGECHPDKHASWRDSLHAVMNQRADAPGAIVGDFDDATVRYAGGTARFTRAGDDYAMTLQADGQPARRYRITRTIGVEHLQEYVGVLVDGPEPRDAPAYATEVRLPFGYWRRTGRWLHQQYFDSWYGPEHRADGAVAVDPYAPPTAPWAERCAWCHNTYPFDLRALRSDRRALGQGPEIYFALDDPRPSSAALPDAAMVTVGISCESCHLGGREHAVEGADIHFVPTSPALALRPDAPDLSGGRDNPVVVNTLCAQCHSTPANRYPDGSVTRNSSEALDMAAGACMSQIACTDCHDPHRKHARPAPPCVRCHEDLPPDHAHHADADAQCVDCHMPRIVQGIDRVVRTHRISSPTSAAMFSATAPNACNLCHVDETLDWTLDALATLWDVQVDVLDGGTAAPMGERWLHSASRDTRIAAAAAVARRDDARAWLPALVAALDDPIAYNRMWILFAIEDALGRPLTDREYNPTATREARSDQARQLLDSPDAPRRTRSVGARSDVRAGKLRQRANN